MIIARLVGSVSVVSSKLNLSMLARTILSTAPSMMNGLAMADSAAQIRGAVRAGGSISLEQVRTGCSF